MPEKKLEKKIDEKTAYAKAPWVPLRIETGDLGITTPPSQSHDKLVKLGYSFKLLFIPNSGYPFRGWQAWIEGEGIHSLWRNNAVEQDAAYQPERVKFVPLNSSGTEVEVFVYEMPPEDKRLIIGPWGSTNDELTVLPNSGGLGSIYPARLSGVKRDFPFTLSFQPSQAYPFQGWQAKFFSGGVLLGESVWTVAETGSGEQRVNGVLWSPRNASGLEIDVTVEETPEGFLPTEGSIVIGPLGMDNDLLDVRVSGGGLGTAGSTLTVAAPARKGYPFTLSFQPSAAYPFRGWQAKFLSGDGSVLAESAWAVEDGSGEQRVNGVLWSPRNVSGLEMDVTVEETPEGFLAAEGSIIIGPLGMDNNLLNVRVSGGGLGTAGSTLTVAAPARKGYPFTLSFQPSPAYPFRGWQVLFLNDDGSLLILSAWAVEDGSGEQRVNGVLWSPQNTSGLEMRVTIEAVPTDFPTNGSIVIGPLGMDSENAPLSILASAEWGITNPPPGELSDKKLGFPFTVEFAVASGWAFVEWRAYSYEGTVEKWSRDNPGVLLGTGDVKISDQGGGKAEVTIYTGKRVTLIPYCIKRAEVTATNLPGHFDDRKVTNYPIKIWFSHEIADECITWDNFIFMADTNQGMEPTQTLEGEAITKYYKTPERDGKKVSIVRNMEVDASDFVNLNITIRLNLGGIYYKTGDIKVPMGEPGQYREFYYGISSFPYTQAPSIVNLNAETRADETISLISSGNAALKNEKKYYVPVNGERVVYLLFDKRGLEESIRREFTRLEHIRITEERDGEFRESRYDYQFEFSPAGSPFIELATEYKTKHDDKEPYIISHVLKTTGDGVIQLAVQPFDDLGNHADFSAAQKVQVILDTTRPGQVTNVNATYSHEAKTLNLEWTNPVDPDFDKVLLSWGIAGETQSKVDLPSNNSTSHVFSGITPPNRYTFSFSTVDVAGNANVHPVTVHAVTFNSNGGTPTFDPQYVLAGRTTTKPADPTRTGYNFDGWYTNDNFSTKWNFDTNVTANMTLYAKWLATVKFESNGGTTVSDQYILPDGKVQPVNSTRSGYALEGWYTEAAFTNKWTFNTDTVKGQITLYAKWLVTVNFESNGGTPAPATQNVDHGGKVTEPPAMTRTGYTFGGWFKEAALTNQWNFNDDTVTAPMTLYARWTINTYIVTFDANSGTPAPAEQIDHGGKVPEPTGVTRSGYTLEGWYRDNNTFNNQWNFNTDTVTRDVTLFAKWELITIVLGADLEAKLQWLKTNAISGVNYTVEVTSVASNNIIAPHTLSYSDKTNIKVTLIGVDANSIVTLSSNGTMFTVGSGVTLVLDNNITLQGRNSNNAALVRVDGGTLEMKTRSVIKDNINTSTTTGNYGGGVRVNSGTFTMSGGTISGNKANFGGGVFVNTNGTFTMSGGTISGNTATTDAGGGVYVNNKFTMSGGAISGNTATTYGGGVAVSTDGTFIMNGGIIGGTTTNDKNTSTTIGGGVHVSGSFTMSGTAEIFGNTGTNGGGVYVSSTGTFTMEDGTISGNTAGTNGGGVYVNKEFTMNGGTISGNTATEGGGVWVGGGTFTMTGGIIGGTSSSSKNTATTYGGGVKVRSGTVFTMSGGTISGNTAPTGGGVDSNGTITMSGTAKISNNIATNGSGGVGFSGTFTMNGGEISSNTSNTSAGGVGFNNGTFTMNGGTIYGNTAVTEGGGVRVSTNGTFRIVTGTVYGSNASTTTDRNTANQGAALFNGGTAQRGTLNQSTGAWTGTNIITSGNTYNNTIRVVNGVVVQ